MKPENILIFNKEVKKPQRNFIPRMDVEDIPIDKILPKKFHRGDLKIPEIPEPWSGAGADGSSAAALQMQAAQPTPFPGQTGPRPPKTHVG